jgi:hypothetical protein
VQVFKVAWAGSESGPASSGALVLVSKVTTAAIAAAAITMLVTLNMTVPVF